MRASRLARLTRGRFGMGVWTHSEVDRINARAKRRAEEFRKCTDDEPTRSKMPVSTDLVFLEPASGGRVAVRCDICLVELGTVNYLNQAIHLWLDHQEVERAK